MRGQVHSPDKRRAADWFARGRCRFLPEGATYLTFPTSRAPDDPNHDDRFEPLTQTNMSCRCNLVPRVGALRRVQTHTALHEARGRTPAAVSGGLLCQYQGDPAHATCFVIEDVRRPGSHRIAAPSRLRDRDAHPRLVGIRTARQGAA